MTKPRIAYIFEYGGRSGDWMMQSLVDELRKRLPALQDEHIHGAFPVYRPGGLRPRRLANLLWVYVRTAALMLFRPPKIVLVRSSPPAIQVWTAWWAAWRRIPVVCWLMDYHPEIEARSLEARGWRSAAQALRAIDRSAMRRFAVIVTLDPAMTAMARDRAQQVPILEHPTWGALREEVAPVGYPLGARDRPLNLAYSGNLGAAHPLPTLQRLLAEVVRGRSVQLFVVGASREGEGRFRELGAALGISIVVHARVPFSELGRLYEEWRVDAGIVLLATDSAGLVSPSKFSGYIDYGLPVIYIGPAGTNAAVVCDRFGAGFWLEENTPSAALQAAAGRLLDDRALTVASHGAQAAARHFAGRNASSLAGELAPYLERLANA